MLFNIAYFGFFQSIIIFIIVIFSISLHEFSHALVATLQGDHTAKLNGRLTLNPLAHFEQMGFLLILLTNFGWGKPVPINPQNLKNYKTGTAVIAIAGPISNILIAISAAILIRVLYYSHIYNTNTFGILEFVVLINLGLAIFNLLPFPPLDGSNIYRPFLPAEIQIKMSQFNQTYILILFALAFLPIINGNSVISIILSPVLGFFGSILIP